ncbi:LacI family DNA-binding transcriptional regulator [Gordonia sp. OPL2]|uniref:LacI family DNA-binding transcriptional regulator n=1 Tax=Gordonia sp. OPL2 TaxID=2486274 RepID=UPI001655ADE1|nr:LacI family DNA-binding transcriptional regulator [Gordonia sp. OPL2]ROZ99159.1 LacI family transcriptional regulator [Gordonia sp. OPL2]
MGARRGGRVTLADVAHAAGVSTALVSIVMRGVAGASDETRERVLSIAGEMGYVPDQRARKLRQASSRLLGVTFELREPFHGDLVEEAYRVAGDVDYDVVISAVAPSRSESTALDTVVRERCEAVILLGSRLSDDALAALAERLPVVVVARDSNAPGVGYVRSDDTAGVGLAVDHLVGLGHRRIVHIDGGDAPGAADRRAGFSAAMAERGLSSASIVAGGLTQIDGARATRDLVAADGSVTAVVAFNDECATGVIDVLIRAGWRVPEDVSVIGYDDARPASRAPVPLTTVSQDAGELAADAVAGALAMIDGGPAPRIVRRPRLVVRATTGPVRR